MKISVVIPAYNEEQFLPRVLQSLQKQTFTLPYEVIVVDNNSTDNTAKVATDYGARVIFESKRGASSACNTGFNISHGQIIARTDADSLLPSDWLEKIWTAFQKDKTLVAIGGPTYPMETYWWENFFYFPTTLFWMHLLKIMGKGFLFCNIAVRKDIYKKCGGFDTSLVFGEDTNLCQKLKKFGKVKLLPHVYIYTSIRRLRALGIAKFAIQYGLGGELAKITQKPPQAAIAVIRHFPSQDPHPHTPWPYILSTPIFVALFAALSFHYWLTVQNPHMLSTTADREFKRLVAFGKNLEEFPKKADIQSKLTPYLQKYNFSEYSNL